jgi:hypothetical protein
MASLIVASRTSVTIQSMQFPFPQLESKRVRIDSLTLLNLDATLETFVQKSQPPDQIYGGGLLCTATQFSSSILQC